MSHLEEMKEEFFRIFQENITREGSDRFLEWLAKTDFFTGTGQLEVSLCL